MPVVVELVVDGTNIAWAWQRSRELLLARDFAGAQRLLVDAAQRSELARQHQEMTFIFDGPPPAGGPSSRGGLRVLYPDPGQSADQRILELAEQRQHMGRHLLLVTSDRELRELARRHGAQTVGGATLIARLDPAAVGTNRIRRSSAPSQEKPSPSRSDTERWLRDFRRRGRG